MKRALQIGMIVVLLAACGAPASIPTEAPRPTVMMVIEAASPTATDEATFTPIPATFTLEPTSTATSTLTPTLKATSTIAATATKIKATIAKVLTKAPTRTKAPTAIPTIFLPTDTPAPVVIEPTNPPAAGCCKTCRKGKACGDSCIAADKTCNLPPGCACQG